MLKTFVILGCVLAFLFLVCASVIFRLFLKNPFKVVFYALKDFFMYFVRKKYNNAKYVGINVYCGLFGSGKTLSMVHDAYELYLKYNNKPVWSEEYKKFVTQQIVFISNVELQGVPTIYLTSVDQIVSIAEVGSPDPENYLVIYYVLIDELSMCLNSRRFKSNFESSSWLQTLICSRHYNINGVLGCSQRFSFVDKLFRECTFKVIECKKLWRFVTQKHYDAWDYENATQIVNLKPLYRTGWYATDKFFKLYNTKAVVEVLLTDAKNNLMLSAEEIIALRGDQEENDEKIQRKSFTYKWKNRKENRWDKAALPPFPPYSAEPNEPKKQILEVRSMETCLQHDVADKTRGPVLRR